MAPRLKLGLSPEQLAERRKGIGGSDAPKIMAGEWLPLWLDKTGEAEPEDLSGNLAVCMGSFTEPLNLHWWERQTGRRVTNEGEVRISSAYPFMRCTLDGLTDDGRTVFQAKHVSAYSKMEEVYPRYHWQLVHEATVVGATRAVLSVFFGSNAWDFVEIEVDEFDAARLVERERAFWRHVETGEAPGRPEAVAAPPMPTSFRTVDFEALKHNEWAHHAGAWLANRGAASLFRAAEKDLKALVEPDVEHAFGFGISIKRSRAGSLTIKEAKHA